MVSGHQRPLMESWGVFFILQNIFGKALWPPLDPPLFILVSNLFLENKCKWNLSLHYLPCINRVICSKCSIKMTSAVIVLIYLFCFVLFCAFSFSGSFINYVFNYWSLLNSHDPLLVSHQCMVHALVLICPEMKSLDADYTFIITFSMKVLLLRRFYLYIYI